MPRFVCKGGRQFGPFANKTEIRSFIPPPFSGGMAPKFYSGREF